MTVEESNILIANYMRMGNVTRMPSGLYYRPDNLRGFMPVPEFNESLDALHLVWEKMGVTGYRSNKLPTDKYDKNRRFRFRLYKGADRIGGARGTSFIDAAYNATLVAIKELENEL